MASKTNTDKLQSSLLTIGEESAQFRTKPGYATLSRVYMRRTQPRGTNEKRWLRSVRVQLLILNFRHTKENDGCNKMLQTPKTLEGSELSKLVPLYITLHHKI